MARFVSDNPKNSKALTVNTTGFTITSTGPSGTVNVSTSVAALERGQSVILHFTSGTAGGFTNDGEYFVIPVASGSFKVASTRANAINDVYLASASGNAGGGTAYGCYKVGGTLYTGTGGDINMRGLGVEDTGLSSFCVHKNVADSAVYPFMIKDICGSGTSASDFVIWVD
jgi:hypothetical protein